MAARKRPTFLGIKTSGCGGEVMETAIAFAAGMLLTLRTPARELEAESRGVQERLSAENCLTGTLTDAGVWAAIMPEAETESLGGVRSQRRRCLPSVDE